MRDEGILMRDPLPEEEPEATTFLDAGERAAVREGGALEVSW